MARKYKDDAIVLRTFNVGETDRFCLLLTKTMGRIAARVHGARTTKSRHCRGLLALHRVSVTLEEHGSSMRVCEAVDTTPWTQLWHHPEKFGRSFQMIEMILRSTEERSPLPEVYALLEETLSRYQHSSSPSVPTLFTLQYMTALGFAPLPDRSCVSHLPFSPQARICFHAEHGGFCTKEECPSLPSLSDETLSIIRSIAEKSATHLLTMSARAHQELNALSEVFVRHQFGCTFACSSVIADISSGVTPIS